MVSVHSGKIGFEDVPTPAGLKSFFADAVFARSVPGLPVHLQLERRVADGPSGQPARYDAAGQLVYLQNLRSDGGVISGFTYTYDYAGNRTHVLEDTGAQTTWTYDETYQLTREQRTPLGWEGFTLDQWLTFTLDQWDMFSLDENGYDIQYQYDPLGNRLVKSADGGLTTSTYDIANQLQTSEDCDGVTTYTFDPAGNQHLVEAPSGALTTNTWDDENRRVLVELPSGQRVTSAYNAGGLRIRKESSAGDTKFIWDQQNYLQETDENDATQVAYTNKPAEYGELVSQYRWTGAIWVAETYHFDALGSTTELTDENEDVVESYRYDAFGNKNTANGDISPFTFLGKFGYYADACTEDYYVRARNYSPSASRWLAIDPLRDDFSLYRYVRNNPVNKFDPSGLVLRVEFSIWPTFMDYILGLLNQLCPEGNFQRVSPWHGSTVWDGIQGYVVSGVFGFCRESTYLEWDWKKLGCLRTKTQPRKCGSATHPASCCCICDAITMDKTITIRFRPGGTKGAGPSTSQSTMGSGILDTINMPVIKNLPGIEGVPHGVRPTHDIVPIPTPAYIAVSHELCGHAVPNLFHWGEDRPPGFKPDPVIKIENDIRDEHSTEDTDFGIRENWIND